MYKLIIIAVSFFTASAFAQLDERPGSRGPHNASLDASFSQGGFALGGAYEYIQSSNLGMGVYFQEFQKETKAPNQSNGYIFVGGFLAQHYYKKAWDFSVAPGFALINISSYRTNPGDTTTLGPSLGIALLYQVNSSVAIGFENNRYWAWFDRDFNGMLKDDMAIKVRATF